LRRFRSFAPKEPSTSSILVGALRNSAQVSPPPLVTSHGVVTEREQAVLEAARDERRERKALEALGAPQKGWTETQAEAHQAQLERWLTASRRLANALNALTERSEPEVIVHRL
jgi:hypothetical protein